MSTRQIIGSILVIGTVLTPFAIHFGMCLRRLIENLKNGEELDDDAAYVFVYIAAALIGTGIVLILFG